MDITTIDRVASCFEALLMLGVIAWVAYQVFFKKEAK